MSEDHRKTITAATAIAFAALCLTTTSEARAKNRLPSVTFICEDYGEVTISPIGDGRRVNVDSIDGKRVRMKAVGDGNPPMFQSGRIVLVLARDFRTMEMRFPGYRGGPCSR